MLHEQLTILKETRKDHPRELEQIAVLVGKLQIMLEQSRKHTSEVRAELLKDTVDLTECIHLLQQIKAFSNRAHY